MKKAVLWSGGSGWGSLYGQKSPVGHAAMWSVTGGRDGSLALSRY